MITFAQIKRIHTLKSMLGIDDELYREMLASFAARRQRAEVSSAACPFNAAEQADVRTSKNLTQAEADVLIDILAQKQMSQYKKRYETLKNRDDEMATPLQLRKIEAMWSEVCDAQDRVKALRTFIQNKFKISDMRFVTKRVATSLIFVIEKIKQKKVLKRV